jgi:thiol-disulfide isomerase/thioredoxin
MRALLSTLLLATVALAAAQNKADGDFAKIQTVQPPAFDAQKYEKDKDAYVKEYEAAVRKADGERNKLILAFYKAYPEDARTPDLMVQRWMAMFNAGGKPTDLLKDIDGVAAKVDGEPMQAAAAYARIVVRLQEGEKFDVVKAITDFRAAHKESKHYEALLNRAVFEVPSNKRKPVIELFVQDFPDHRFTGMLKGQLRQMEAVGKPFELSFDDAITGKKVDMSEFKGKVVMIDWWATWCGPCVAELPHVKEIYKKYKDQGFEIIGVSLDYPEARGGLKALKDFVAKNDMPWPQYYQGNGWDSTFSSSWGIMSIPNVFLVDKEGILREIEVANLEESLKKLLAKS